MRDQIVNMEMKGNREGFSLVEILMAMSMLAVVMVTLASLTFTVAKRQIQSTANSYTQSLLMQHANRLLVIPFDSLTSSRAGCTTVTTGPLPHTRCITITNNTSARKTVKIKVTPTRSSTMPADSVSFERDQITTSNPFNI